LGLRQRMQVIMATPETAIRGGRMKPRLGMCNSHKVTVTAAAMVTELATMATGTTVRFRIHNFVPVESGASNLKRAHLDIRGVRWRRRQTGPLNSSFSSLILFALVWRGARRRECIRWQQHRLVAELCPIIGSTDDSDSVHGQLICSVGTPLSNSRMPQRHTRAHVS